MEIDQNLKNHLQELGQLLQKILSNDINFDQLLKEIKIKLETLLKFSLNPIKDFLQNSKSKIQFLQLLEKINAKLLYPNIFDILSLFINHTKYDEKSLTKENSSTKNSNLFLTLNDYEFHFNEGTSLLISHQLLEEILKLYEDLIEKDQGKNSHPKFFQNLLESIKLSYTGPYKEALIKRCINIVISMCKKGYTLSDDFWRVNIEGLTKLQNFELIGKLVSHFEFKNYNVNSMLRPILKIFFKKDSLLDLFHMIETKYEKLLTDSSKILPSSNSLNDINTLESILNIFLEEMTDSLANLNENQIRIVYNSIIQISLKSNNRIKIRETLIEIFLSKISIKYRGDNCEIVEDYLISSGRLLTKRILEKIICELAKINDFFLIFLIVKLCKKGRISVDFDDLNIDSDVLKNVFNFVIGSMEFNLDDSKSQNESQNSQIYFDSQSELNLNEDKISDGMNTDKENNCIENSRGGLVTESLSFCVVDSLLNNTFESEGFDKCQI